MRRLLFISALLALTWGGPALAADPPEPMPASYAQAPDDVLSSYYAEQLADSPLEAVAGLQSDAQRGRLRSWLTEHFQEGRRMVVFVSPTSEAARRHGTYFIIATVGLGDRQDDWTTEAPVNGGTLALSGTSIVHLRQTGFVGERFLRAARQGEGLLACNLHPDARWSIEVDEEASEAHLSVSLGPDAPSEMHALFRDCKPKPIDELRQ